MRLLFLVIFAVSACHAFAQRDDVIDVRGRVYDRSRQTGLEAVTVMSTGGQWTMTDSLGYYRISLPYSDTLYFSYQNKETARYPVSQMQDPTQFSIALHVYIATLPNVIVRAPRYQIDSMMNREFYAKIFDWQKPNPLKSVNVGPTGVGMDPNAIINLFRFRNNRRIAALQERLIQEEQDKYIDFRFSRSLVKKLTGLDGDDLTKFMNKYRPPYDFCVLSNELEMGYYVQQCYIAETGKLPEGKPYFLQDGIGVNGNQ